MLLEPLVFYISLYSMSLLLTVRTSLSVATVKSLSTSKAQREFNQVDHLKGHSFTILSLSPNVLLISWRRVSTLSLNQNQTVPLFKSANRVVMVRICSLALCCCHFSAKSAPPSSLPHSPPANHIQCPGRAHQSIPHHVLITSIPFI